MPGFETLTEAINDLKARGYELDFNLRENYIECVSKGLQLSPNEFEITEVHRFEGPTDPADECILYAVESKSGLKGLIVNAYGKDANPISQELVKKLATHKPS